MPPGLSPLISIQQLRHLSQVLVQSKKCPPVRLAFLNPCDQPRARLQIVRFQVGCHEQLIGLDR